MDEQTNPPTEGEQKSPQQDDARMLRELALALILPRHGMMETTDGAAPELPELLVGQVAPDFGDDFPVPPGARVLGSLAAAQPILVLSTDEPGEDVVTFYRQRLVADGWSEEAFPGPMHGGFLHSAMVGRQLANFYRNDGATLHVMTYVTFAAPDNRTVAQITRGTDDSGGMRAQRRARGMGRDPWQTLPPIAPPPRAEQYQEGGSSGDDRVITSARIESDADLATLAAHYIAQLARAGWQRQASDESDPVAWSAWTFEDEQDGEKQPWRALFVLLKWPGDPRRCWAQLIAERVDKHADAGGHVQGRLIGWQSHTAMGTLGGS